MEESLAFSLRAVKRTGYAPRQMNDDIKGNKWKVSAIFKVLTCSHPPTAKSKGFVSAFSTLPGRLKDLNAVVAVAREQANSLAMVVANQLERQISHPPREGPNPDKVEPLAEKDSALRKRKLAEEAHSAPRKPPKRARKPAQRCPLNDSPGTISRKVTDMQPIATLQGRKGDTHQTINARMRKNAAESELDGQLPPPSRFRKTWSPIRTAMPNSQQSTGSLSFIQYAAALNASAPERL